MSSSSKKRSHSAGGFDHSPNEQISNDIYQLSVNNTGLFPTMNPSTIVSNTNHNSSIKTNNNMISRPKLFQYIDENIIGKDHIFQGPWGLRRSMYI